MFFCVNTDGAVSASCFMYDESSGLGCDEVQNNLPYLNFDA